MQSLSAPARRALPKYPPREQVVEYLESYAANFRIQPVFDTTVLKVARNGAHGRVPLLDIGTLAKIRDGSIRVRGGIRRFTPDGMVFSNQDAQRSDAIILATGFRPDLRSPLQDADGALTQDGKPLVTGQATNKPGLYFCGLIASPTGQLREIGLEAGRIADLARHYVDQQASLVGR